MNAVYAVLFGVTIGSLVGFLVSDCKQRRHKREQKHRESMLRYIDSLPMPSNVAVWDFADEQHGIVQEQDAAVSDWQWRHG